MNKFKTMALLLLLSVKAALAQPPEKKFSVALGGQNVREQQNNLSGLATHSFLRTSYAPNKSVSFNVETGSTYLSLPDKWVKNISPSVQWNVGKMKADVGFSRLNNELYLKGNYALGTNMNAVVQLQNLSKKLPETSVLPQLPQQFNLAAMTMCEAKIGLAKDVNNQKSLAMKTGLGLRHFGQETGLAYEALFIANWNGISAVAGVQPIHALGFKPQAFALLQYTAKF